jgi:hypothetical protein
MAGLSVKPVIGHGIGSRIGPNVKVTTDESRYTRGLRVLGGTFNVVQVLAGPSLWLYLNCPATVSPVTVPSIPSAPPPMLS